MKINVEFDNLSEAQAVALEEFFAVWLFLKEKKMSMWTAMFADGTNDFQPDITVNGEEAKKYTGDIGWRVGKIGFKQDDLYLDDEMYLMDYERIQKILDQPSED
jgi:hypothetical protein